MRIVKELTKVECFFKKVWACSHVGCWCSKRCWYMSFERNDGIWISHINLDLIPQLGARYWDSILPHSCSSIIYTCSSEPFLSVILCDTLFQRSKLIFFTFESADKYIFLYIKDAPFNRKILLKLIHFKSLIWWVTWSRFKYFPLLATFAAKLIYFCTSYYSFSLDFPYIELQ